MRFRMLLGIVAAAALSGQVQQEPRYDPASSANFLGTVTEIREVAKGNPLMGLHMMVNTEKDTSIEVYVAPVSYLKELKVTYSPGDRVQVTGSKVKFGGGSIVLVREVRKDSDTAYFRDEKGKPYWTGGPT